jgi:hypothetical protein
VCRIDEIVDAFEQDLAFEDADAEEIDVSDSEDTEGVEDDVTVNSDVSVCLCVSQGGSAAFTNLAL